MSRQRASEPMPYRYRLADLDEIFSDAEARADADVEQRRDSANRRSNWRVLGIVLAVAAGLAVITADLVDHIVSMMMNVFSAT